MYRSPADSTVSNPRERRRALGPIGTAARAIAGGLLILVPIASDGLARWDAFGALIVLPALSLALGQLLAAGVTRLAEVTGRLASDVTRTWSVHLSALVLILVSATALTYVTPIDAGAIWLFFGVSLVVAAVRGDAGCEAVAIPNAIFRRRERIGCVVFVLVDSLEGRSRAAAQQP
jgi:hypothetical protein